MAAIAFLLGATEPSSQPFDATRIRLAHLAWQAARARQHAARHGEPWRSCQSYYATDVLIPAAHSSTWMEARWGDVLRIWLTEAADPPHCVETLLEGCEATIHGLVAHVVHRTPRIILGLGRCPHRQRSDINSQGK